MAPVLPDDVIEDILARLPAKSAVRCRSLSHAWAAKLSSDHFVDLHLHLANRHGAPRILILQDPVDPDDERPPKVHACSAAASSSSRPATGARVHYVFNPSTGQSAALPEGRYTGRRSLRVKVEEDPDGHHKYARVGIGYDARTRRHKVVRVYYRGCDTKKKPPGCEVYVVNGSTGLWRPASGGALEKPAGWVNQNDTSVFAQGHVHWLAKRNLDSPPGELSIVSFSRRREVWDRVAATRHGRELSP
ncbi:hypothetical protein BRADI_1g34780v3 [Brachypodium distachyon]|uniref:F-box domain-containing protein n=1 Tax=Brachypodium distachyon TaxID=15368 RepID=A0A0Q3JZU5_BRADI|nr:hypothetical protein BRADI_1g34780v3 [Brachypodium distachyon]